MTGAYHCRVCLCDLWNRLGDSYIAIDGRPDGLFCGACLRQWWRNELCVVLKKKAAVSGPVWWLSYGGENGSNGVVIVEGGSFLEACGRSRALGLSPGGQVLGYCIPEDVRVFGAEYRNRFFSPDEARQIGRLL